MTSATELLPCPFCGGEANIIDHHNDDGSVSVGCNNDTCLGFSGLGWLYKTEAEVIAAWNTRAATTIGKVQVEVEPVLHGTLTAEQVRKAIFAGSVYTSYDGAQYYANGISMKAIADELNAMLVSGVCKNIAPEYLDFLCSECGFVHYHSDENDSGDGNDWAFCPQCGKAVKR